MDKERPLLLENAINMINTREHSMDLNSKTEMVQSLDREGRIIDVSPGWLSRTGYSREEVVGRFLGEFLVDESVLKAKIEFPHLKGYGFVNNVRLNIKCKGGIIVEAALNGTSKYSDDGKFERTFCELRTLDYYMNSAEAISQLLIHEKFLRMVEYIRANITAFLLKGENYDYYNALSEILNEPPEIETVAIEPDECSCDELDDNKNLIIEESKKYIEENDFEKESKVFVIEKKENVNMTTQLENRVYKMIIKINDSLMPGGERLLIIEFKSQKQLIKEWKEAFASISKLIESVMQWVRLNRENKKLISELKILSETDKLTGIYNRMVLDRVLLKQKHSYERYGENCSIIIMDVDNFKKVNDNYGHNAGDKVLDEIADLLKKSTRKTDVVGRWGGEEFLIVCEHTELKNAMILAEILREKIECHSFLKVGNLTASFGVSTFSDGMTVEQLVGKADKALYKAKTGGRNRISA